VQLQIIVQAAPGYDLAGLVERRGGQVTCELSVINAVAARLPLCLARLSVRIRRDQELREFLKDA
jgi:hypothetical protein